MRNPLTPAGIEPATFRFVAQHLNHCASTVPLPVKSAIAKMIKKFRKTGSLLDKNRNWQKSVQLK